jgi:predicted DNA-binding mobile mystery protein A
MAGVIMFTKTNPNTSLMLTQVDRRLKKLRAAMKESRVKPGWIHYMRQALGMTLKTLAHRTGGSIATVAQAERGEAKGKITLETLKKMAKAMDCEFVYAFIPQSSVQEILKEQAQNKARLLLQQADTHMSLEDQRVEQDLKERIERLAQTFLNKGDIW